MQDVLLQELMSLEPIAFQSVAVDIDSLRLARESLLPYYHSFILFFHSISPFFHSLLPFFHSLLSFYSLIHFPSPPPQLVSPSSQDAFQKFHKKNPVLSHFWSDKKKSLVGKENVHA